ncbi:MAG: diguanylate cyclase [Acidobacteriota bacterium]
MNPKNKILIVDDEKDNVNCLARWFEREGLDIISAYDGQHALDMVEKHHPDLIILDIIMPGLDGLEVARRLKADSMFWSIPIIMLTAKHEMKNKVEGFRIGVDDYVTKPFDFEEVDARIKAMLRKRELYLELEKKKLQLDQTNLKLKEMAITDDKTSLFNHRYFLNKLKEEFKRTKRYGTSLSIIMLDLDDFKEINDIHGHQRGDRILREVGRIIQSNARETDFVARYGGEEFAVILPNSDAQMAKQVAERIRKAVSVHVFKEEKSSLAMTISAGIATFPDNAMIKNADELIHSADAALYMAKKKGKNRTEIDGGSIFREAPERGAKEARKDKRV